MNARDILLVLAVVCLQTTNFVRAAPPDWVPKELIDMVQGDKERCMGEHGTTQELIDKVNDGNLIEDRSISCYMHCLLDAFSLVDEEGNLEADTLISFLPENLAPLGQKILGQCAKQDGADGCEKIFKVAKCVQALVPELWFMV